MKSFGKGKRVLSLVMLLVLFCLSSGTNVFAEDTYKNQVINANANTWIQAKERDSYYDEDTWDYTYTDYYYKITVPSSGYLEFQTKDTEIYLYKRITDNNSVGHVYSNSTDQIIVDKGTYYFEGSGPVKYTFTAVKPLKNYCRKKAAKLNAGKTIAVCMSRINWYARWYKIKLKKKKAITYWTNDNDDIYICDAKGNYIEAEHAGTLSNRYFTERLKKGTYYVCIDPSVGYVTKFKWK